MNELCYNSIYTSIKENNNKLFKKTSYDIKDLYNVKSVCSTAFSKSSILQIANTQANHGSKVTYTLAGVNVKETW